MFLLVCVDSAIQKYLRKTTYMRWLWCIELPRFCC